MQSIRLNVPTIRKRKAGTHITYTRGDGIAYTIRPLHWYHSNTKQIVGAVWHKVALCQEVTKNPFLFNAVPFRVACCEMFRKANQILNTFPAKQVGSPINIPPT